MFWKHRALLNKTTKDDDTPTPGYLYNDINKITFESPLECTKVINFLLTKVTKNNSGRRSPAVNLKCLMIMRHTLQNGSAQFHRELSSRSDVIRQCSTFRGPPHPLHGDAPYKMVREQAQLVLNLLFASTPTRADPNQGRPTQYQPTKQMDAMGGGYPSGAGKVSNGSQKTYSGIGNTNFKPNGDSSLRGKIQEGIDRTGRMLHRSVTKSSSRKPGSNIGGSPSTNYTSPQMRGASAFTQSNSGSIHNVVPPSAQLPEVGPRSKGQPMGGWGAARCSHTNIEASGSSHLETTILKMTGAGGVRSTPSTSDMNKFARLLAENTEHLEILDILINIIETSRSWQSKLKSLHYLERMTRVSTDIDYSYIIPVLQENSTSVQKSICEKCKKILRRVSPDQHAVPDATPPDIGVLNVGPAQTTAPVVGTMEYQLDDPTDEFIDEEASEAAELFAGLSVGDNQSPSVQPPVVAHQVAKPPLAAVVQPRAVVHTSPSPTPPTNAESLILFHDDVQTNNQVQTPTTLPADLQGLQFDPLQQQTPSYEHKRNSVQSLINGGMTAPPQVAYGGQVQYSHHPQYTQQHQQQHNNPQYSNWQRMNVVKNRQTSTIRLQVKGDSNGVGGTASSLNSFSFVQDELKAHQ